ncbi:mini-chromosome maintenance complex-binding protein [Halyomorpha halys]|uniref:mini-chromosome maintenance complex-binding protein n=1 Tax=Halyomorpha halys TaxID=286706 RepID=UPI0006D508F2|nr:mini-chromosome maintenance complex-binding protein [Halyomorpha halys]
MFDLKSFNVQSINQSPAEGLKFVNDNWEKIPTLDSCDGILKDGHIMKFRGMIQDMPNPVFYYSKYEINDKNTGLSVIRNGKYMDTLECNENEVLNLESDSCENGERRLYYMIPIPSLSHWAQNKYDVKSNVDSMAASSTESNDLKRSSETMDMDVDSSDTELSKRLCTSQPDKATTSNTNLDLKSNSTGCLAVMYDVPESSLKLNDVIEIVGFVYRNPLPNDGDEFDDSYKPPSPLTPRMHVISFRQIKNCNPLINDNVASLVMAEAESIRSDLHLVLSQLMFGDVLAADYLLCHLLAQIYHRNDNVDVLGKLSLNISNIPGVNFAEYTFQILSNLLPKIRFYPFTIENLNATKLLPKKNYKTGHLEQGILQLSDNTHLIVDETKLDEGKLLETGVKNVNALKNLIKCQKLDYDFTYYNVGFCTDIPVLVLSQTPSILPHDAQVELIPDKHSSSNIEDNIASINKFLTGPLLDKIRIYLTVAANLTYKLPEEFQSIVQNDFVELRQKDSKFSVDDLHELIVVARLLSLSYGKTSLDQSIWEKSKSMVTGRKSRKAS